MLIKLKATLGMPAVLPERTISHPSLISILIALLRLTWDSRFQAVSQLLQPAL
jgi:hypothetical protein